MIEDYQNPILHPLLRSQKELAATYKFRLGDLEPTITLRIYKYSEKNSFAFEISHTIKTPEQIGPYKTSPKPYDSKDYTIQMAISGLTQQYEAAVKAGHKPNNDWLVPKLSDYLV